MAFYGRAPLTIAIYPFGEKWTKGKLELTVLDVGQGRFAFCRVSWRQKLC